ncbi:hypothetical protein L6452_32540 [Arctium lappa]|uniref:Uncharacterized protein n=1 Tax=Arctium lappa TaxID=4217 RepID=A0ACB8Z5S6_ARCLA|nr:hypothetical protein L6452_32540 [Arctium lappa]
MMAESCPLQQMSEFDLQYQLMSRLATHSGSYGHVFLAGVPKSFLLSIIGEDRVTKFVIQEIVSSTMADYVKKNNICVKDNKINTIQSAEELESSFNPGSDFGFNATLELEKPDTETSISLESSEA